MARIRIVVAVLALAVFGGGWLLGDDPKKPDAPKVTHTLPSGWKALGLSDDQKKKIHAIQDEYGPKIAALKKQMEDLQLEERAKMYDLLTAEQKKQLKDLREIKDSGGAAKDDKKEKTDEKKDEKKP